MSLRKTLAKSFLAFYKQRKRASADLSLENCLHAARVTATNTKYCFLITSGANSWPSARLVEPICDLNEFTFFIGTHLTSRKVKEITACSKVTLAFGNSAENANLIVYGQASISVEPETKRRYWKAAWLLFFPDGADGDDYAVVKVRAETMEIMSFRRNVVAEPFGLRPMVLQRGPGGWLIQAQPDVAADAHEDARR